MEKTERFYVMAIICGVTTNPTIMLKDGVMGGMKGIEQRSKVIARLVIPLPVSVEIIANDKEKMIQQALPFICWANSVNVKGTIHGPNGELENLEIIHQLETKHDIRGIVTAANPSQG